MVKRILAAVVIVIVTLSIVHSALAFAPLAAPQVPAGFVITEFADLTVLPLGVYDNPTAIAVGPDGKLYVALLNGRIYAFGDEDGDDRQDSYQLFANEPPFIAGMTWQSSTLYLTAPDPYNLGYGEVRALQDLDHDGDALEDEETERFVAGLPETAAGLGFDSAGRLYISAAAGCDNCSPDDVRQGALLRYEADGSGEVLYALGLHNAHDLAFYPGTDDLFVPDDGRDDLGTDAPLDELNWVRYGDVGGFHYGWPHCWADGHDAGWGVSCTWTADPLTTLPAHSSPTGLVFHHGQGVPNAFAGSALVALRDTGEVYRIAVTPVAAGYQAAPAELFADGFYQPIDIAVGPDGAIYVTDYAQRKIYLIRALPDLSQSTKTVSRHNPAPGERLTYTLRIVADGPGAAFALTDTLPLSATYLVGSESASAGTLNQSAGLLTWQGTISPNSVAVATFAVQIEATVPSRTVIINTAILSSSSDPTAPYTLSAVAIVDPHYTHLPLVLSKR